MYCFDLSFFPFEILELEFGLHPLMSKSCIIVCFSINQRREKKNKKKSKQRLSRCEDRERIADILFHSWEGAVLKSLDNTYVRKTVNWSCG